MTTFALARAAALASLALVAVGAAHADVFLKVSGALGDASARGFEQQIVLTGASLNISNSPDYDQDGRLLRQHTLATSPITLTKSPDRASPRLMLSAVKGEQLGAIEISFTSAAKPGVPQTTESRWILEGAEVRSFQVYPGADRFQPPVETLEIAYKSMRYQHYVTDAKGVRTGAMEEVKWDAPAESSLAGEEGCG